MDRSGAPSPSHRSPSSANRPSTPRVLIRPPTLGDEAEYLAIRLVDRDWLEPWEPLAAPGFDLFGPEGFHRFVEAANTPTRQRFLVCRVADGRILGQVSLSEIIRGPLQQAYLGYWIARPFAGQGYMAEGVRLVLERAFTELALHRVEANIQPHNAPSIALARRLGFRMEGFSPRYLQIQGVWADHERWAMTREDFDVLRARTGPRA